MHVCMYSRQYTSSTNWHQAMACTAAPGSMTQPLPARAHLNHRPTESRPGEQWAVHEPKLCQLCPKSIADYLDQLAPPADEEASEEDGLEPVVQPGVQDTDGGCWQHGVRYHVTGQPLVLLQRVPKGWAWEAMPLCHVSWR